MLQTSTSLLPPKTPSRTRASHRPLYRGSLSIVGTKITLDGLTFSTSYGIKPETPGASTSAIQLLENPLALALETMRGRPSLRLQGTVKLDDVWIDDDGGIRLDIHPRAVISQMYFQNIFCLQNPLIDFQNDVKSPQSSTKRSEMGLQVSLGDADGPETTQIVIYACPSTDSKVLKLSVARIVQPPVHPAQLQANISRLPRPDDPTPRRPPERLLKRALQRSATSVLITHEGTEPSIDLTPAATTELATKMNTKKKPRSTAEATNNVAEQTQTSNKRKRADMDEMESKLERANKNIIKIMTTTYLTTKPINLSKSDQEFKDLYSAIYRGVQFALRTQLTNTPVDPDEVERIIKAHADLYIISTNSSS